MPIVKVYDVSKIEEVKRISDMVKVLQEDNKYETYNPNNIMLVRTTNIFPENREIKPLASSSVIAKTGNNFICNALYNRIDNNILKQLETYEICYRSTVHFTLNGLVSSHMYGNFDNQSFIILEPLSLQLNRADFRNFAGQDTFVKGPVILSEDAIIIIKEDEYENLRKIYPEIVNFNIILYKGISKQEKERYIKENEYNMPEFDVNDERAVVELALMDLGYTPELIGNHYIINSPTSNKIRSVNEILAQKYNVLSETKHNYTAEYEEDFNKNLMITKIFNEMLLDFILKINNIEEPLILNQYTAFRLVELIGMDNMIESVNKFNRILEEMNRQNLLPTGESLVNGNIPDLFSYYGNNLKI